MLSVSALFIYKRKWLNYSVVVLTVVLLPGRIGHLKDKRTPFSAAPRARGRVRQKVMRVPLFLSFIDVQKAYGSVDRALFCEVLTHFGVPRQMIKVICQIYGGMRDCGRNDDSV